MKTRKIYSLVANPFHHPPPFLFFDIPPVLGRDVTQNLTVMAKITSVRTSVKTDKTLAIIRIEGQDNPVFLTDKQVKAATGLSKNFSVLRGSDLEVEYYAVDEELASGQKCTKANTIVKEFSIELAPDMAKIASAAAFGASMF